jgi:hypothetical protein
MPQPQEPLVKQLAYPTDSANTAFYQALARLCQNDKLLRSAIRFVRAGGFDGQTLVLEINPRCVEKSFTKVLRIVRLIFLTGANFKRINFNNDCVEIDALLKLYPCITKNLKGVFDKKRNMEILTQQAHRYRALLGFATSQATIFVISTAGVYKDVHIRNGTESKIPIEDMLNRSLCKVLPSLETALFIVQQIKEAYAENLPRTIEYGLWDRRYSASIFPIAGNEEVVLACTRIS